MEEKEELAVKYIESSRVGFAHLPSSTYLWTKSESRYQNSNRIVADEDVLSFISRK